MLFFIFLKTIRLPGKHADAYLVIFLNIDYGFLGQIVRVESTLFVK